MVWRGVVSRLECAVNWVNMYCSFEILLNFSYKIELRELKLPFPASFTASLSREARNLCCGYLHSLAISLR